MIDTKIQPAKEEIREQLQSVIDGTILPEDIADWAFSYIKNDDTYINDMNAWHFLTTVSNAAEMIAPDTYLYSNEDYENWIREYS